ncbi:hypothetical protein GCM10009347_42350 [Shewanella algicola]|jgi:hypothetical protein|nr:hypothetical protein GCM10009347_42350 [Shewanella algicola]|tara:strand:- start:615 stop:797 length:183 start_codon:yes stop_codon:yes gene_type:complete
MYSFIRPLQEDKSPTSSELNLSFVSDFMKNIEKKGAGGKVIQGHINHYGVPYNSKVSANL